jgi:hypothetical protein
MRTSTAMMVFTYDPASVIDGATGSVALTYLMTYSPPSYAKV